MGSQRVRHDLATNNNNHLPLIPPRPQENSSPEDSAISTERAVCDIRYHIEGRDAHLKM